MSELSSPKVDFGQDDRDADSIDIKEAIDTPLEDEGTKHDADSAEPYYVPKSVVDEKDRQLTEYAERFRMLESQVQSRFEQLQQEFRRELSDSMGASSPSGRQSTSFTHSPITPGDRVVYSGSGSMTSMESAVGRVMKSVTAFKSPMKNALFQGETGSASSTPTSTTLPASLSLSHLRQESARILESEFGRLSSLLQAASEELEVKNREVEKYAETCRKLEERVAEYEAKYRDANELVQGVTGTVDDLRKALTEREGSLEKSNAFTEKLESRCRESQAEVVQLRIQLDESVTAKETAEKQMEEMRRQMREKDRQLREADKTLKHLDEEARKSGDSANVYKEQNVALRESVKEYEQALRQLRTASHRLALENAMAVEQLAFLELKYGESVVGVSDTANGDPTAPNPSPMWQNVTGWKRYASVLKGIAGVEVADEPRSRSPYHHHSSSSYTNTSQAETVTRSISTPKMRTGVPPPVRERETLSPEMRGERDVGEITRKGMMSRVLRSMYKQPTDAEKAKEVDKYVQELKKSMKSEHGVQLPLKKLPGNFQYMLGNRKVYLKVMNEQLVVRAGGGFQDFLEFLERARF